MRNLFLLLFSFSCLLQVTAVQASHIVGGELNYSYLGNNEYEIILTVYRDYANANPQAVFDNPANVGVYDENDSLVDLFQLTNPIITPIEPPFSNPCLNIPPDIGIEVGVYTGNYTVPSADTGYHFVYQRCCRSSVVGNIDTSNLTGSSFTAFAPAINSFANSNPVFNTSPPLFLCVNAALVYNHSASDFDGDSLDYALCTPLNGAAANNPAPLPPSGPPWGTISWATGFSALNPLGGIPLSINQQTGVLTGTPNTVGQFVVGICVREYRNGVYLGSTIRDFHFVVTNCNNVPRANIPSININPLTGIGDYLGACGAAEVTFANNSSNATEYLWDFGDATTLSDSSRIHSPSYTYPDTGIYLVKLIASNNAGCKDTAYANVIIRPGCQYCDSVSAAFTFDDTTTNYEVSFINQSMNADSVYWTFGDGEVSTSLNPTHIYAESRTYTVCLTAFTDCGVSVYCEEVMPRCPLPVADFDFNFGISNPCEVQFLNQSSGNIDSTVWIIDFIQNFTYNPLYTYNQPGSLQDNITLTVFNACGMDQTIKQLNLPNGCLTHMVDLGKDANFTIHPNPSKGSFILSHQGITEETELQIQNLQGQVVYNQWLKPGSGNEVSISLPEVVTAGTYLVSLREEGKTVQSRLLVVE